MITIDTILENLLCNDENSPHLQNSTDNIEIDEEFCDSAKEFLEQQIEQYPYFTLARALLAMLGNQHERLSGELATFAWAVSYPNVLLKTVYVTAGAETEVGTMLNKEVVGEKVDSAAFEPVSYPVFDTVSNTVFDPMSNAVSGAMFDPVSNEAFDPVSETGFNPVSKTAFDTMSETGFNPVSKTAFDTMSGTGFEPASKTVFDPVEAFINNPSIIRMPKEFQWTHDTQEGEDLSAQFSTLSDEICTETLARIYLRQGNFRNAREIYIRLSLKNPEKSVYFAELISQIDNSYFN